MVISRKYALVLIAILSIIWFMIPSSSTTAVNPGGLELSVRWEDFVEDCGRKVVLSNQVRAKRSFDNKYANNIVDWNGVVHTLYTKKDIQNNPFIGFIVLIKMNPSDANEKFSDLQLVFSNTLANNYAKVLGIIQPGDVLDFKGILRTMGDEFRFHEIEVQSIHLTGTKMNIDDIPMISYVGSGGNMRKSKPGELEGSDKSKTSKTQSTQSTQSETKTQTSSNQNNAADSKPQEQTEKPKEEQNVQNTEPEKVTTNEPVQTNDQTPSTDQVVQDNTEPIQDTPVDDQNNQVNDEPDQVDYVVDDQVVQDNTEPIQDAPVDDQNNQVNDQPDQAVDQVADQTAASNDQANQADPQGLAADTEPIQVNEPEPVQDTNQQADNIASAGDA